MKHLVGKSETKKVKFMGENVEIRKLSVSQVVELQEIVKRSNSNKNQDPMAVLRDTLRLAVVGAEEMSDADFDTFSPVDLNKLSEEILSYCGLFNGEKAGN